MSGSNPILWKKRKMKTFIKIAVTVSLTMCARGEMRTWTSLPEKTFEAEYVKLHFDDVILKDANGGELRIPMDRFSGEDLKYIELGNPPNLSVDFMKSAGQEFIPTSPFLAKDPLNLLMYQFGARVKQKDGKAYKYPLIIEIYAFTQQRYDQDKYHLISRAESEPFVLSKENGRRHEFTAPKEYKVYNYELNVTWLNWREPRGEKFAESLILVRDERGKIIAYNSTKKWLYRNLEMLEQLPIGAWLDADCIRVHPTVPKVTKKSGVDWIR
jgi:hypothetical protein